MSFPDANDDELDVVDAEEENADWDEDAVCLCLWCDKRLESVDNCLEHMRKEHAFDIMEYKKKHHLDTYGFIKLVNYVRQQIRVEKREPAHVQASLLDSRNYLPGEQYLKPVLDDDPLLFEMMDDFQDADFVPTLVSENEMDTNTDEAKGNAHEHVLEQENIFLKKQVADLQDIISQMGSSLQRLSRTMILNTESAPKPSEDEKKLPPSTSKPNKGDRSYFDSYSDREIHETMLKDTVRTFAYRDLFYENKNLFEGKTVLDVGCGTGILCLFAARAGAKRVIGIDNADIIEKTREIIKLNSFENVITLIRGKVEEVSLPSDITKVDFIVSEWMGYFLLYESMLPTVLYARDKWLTPGGKVFPDKAVMYISGVDAAEHRRGSTDFWRDVYGFDMSPLIEEQDRTIAGYSVEVIQPEAVLTDVAELQKLDVLIVKDSELDFTTLVTLTATRAGLFEGFCIWFDTDFSKAAGCQRTITLSTSPLQTPTHWKQSLFYIAKPFDVVLKDRIQVDVKASRRSAYHREYDVVIRWKTAKTDWQFQQFSVN